MLEIQALPTPTTLLKIALRRFADRPAFVDGRSVVTYKALEDTIARFQRILLNDGVRPGRPVVLLSKNRWDAWAAASAVSAIGAIPCWLHPLGTTQSHCEQACLLGPDALIIDSIGFPGHPQAFADAMPGVRLFTFEPTEMSKGLVSLAQNMGTSSLADLSHPECPGMIGLTGGTTGKSKAVERSVASVASMSLATLASFELPIQPNYLAVGPISHVAGSKILPTLMRGGSVSLMQKFDPEEVIARIAQERISFTLAVPTMIYDLLDCPALTRSDLSSLKLLLYGGSAISPHRLAQGLDHLGPIFTQLYGQTECYPIAILDALDHDLSRPELLSACGFPAHGTQICLRNESHQDVSPGEVGEICVRGPGTMARYRDDPGATAEAFADGWLKTGDLGRFDEEGRLYIVDRKKDMIVSGGFNIYPREVEDVLTSLTEVASAAVIGLPHPRWGEAAHAAITFHQGYSLDERQLADHVRSRKGSLLTPKSFTVMTNFPLTAAGKVDKREISRQISRRRSEESRL